MKKLIFTLLVFCLFAGSISAQTLVMPTALKISKIADNLSKKGYKILEQDETYLKLSNDEDASLFIDISEDKKSLLLNINIMLKKDASKASIDTMVEKINNLGMIKGTYNKEKDAIFFQYNFWTSHGFTYESLQDAVAEFFLYQGDTFGMDEEKVFVY